MRSVTQRRALVWLGVGAAVWFVYASGVWAIVVLLLVPFALLAAVPRLGSWLLDHTGWRRVPRLGQLSGFTATLAILGLTLAIGVSGNTLSPLPSPSARPQGANATHTTPGAAAGAANPAVPSPARSLGSAVTTEGAAVCIGKDARANVYHPDRLVQIEACKTVTGTVMTLRREDDGDWHIGLRLDPGQAVPLAAKNLSDQGGNLVLEIICANPVTQADAVSACATYTNTVPVPTIGSHIIATGPFVLDTQHGWNELHPLWGWAPLPAASSTSTGAPVVATTVPTQAPTAAPTPAPSLTTAPTPASTPAPTAPLVAPTPAPATPAPATAPRASTGGVTFTFVSSPVARNATATATVSTAPGASCTIRVTYASGPSTAQGLGPKSADANGVASWSWMVGARTTPGTWPIDVTCGGASAQATFFVQ